MSREGNRVSVFELIMVLEKLPDGAVEPALKSRVDPILSCSIPEGALPPGWKATAENPLQKLPGYRRVVYKGVWR